MSAFWIRALAARLGRPVPRSCRRNQTRLQVQRLEDRTVPTTIVTAVQVNDGSAQRSELRSITVTFSDAVFFAGGNGNAAAAFRLLQVPSQLSINLAGTVTTNAQGHSVVTLTFSGKGTDAQSALNGGVPSLADGKFALTIFSNDILGPGFRPLDGDYDGVPGGDYQSPPDTAGGGPGQLHLYRLFGDANGDGFDDQVDLAVIRSAFNAGIGNPLYLPYLDTDNSGTVDQVDLAQFRTRFNMDVVDNMPPPGFYVNPATGNDANDGRTATGAWKTWGRLVQAVADGTITGGAWVTASGAPADLSSIPTNADKEAWYTAYANGDRLVTGAHIYIDTSAAPLQVTAPLVLPRGCEIESATAYLTHLEVNVPIPATEVWARPDAATDPLVWGTTSGTDYHWTGLYEQVAGHWWAQLLPIGYNGNASTLAEALPQLEANPGSFWVDPATNRLYTHAIAGGNPNADGVARQYVPAWVGANPNARVIDATGGIALRIGGDGGFGFDPTTGQAQGVDGIGSGEWGDISMIDSCQWSRAGKHTFSAVGSNQTSTGLVVFRDDVAEEGPGAVFVGYWSHFVDYSGFEGVGSMMSIYDGDSTVNGWANVGAPGGSDASPTYQALIAHTNGSAPAFSERLIENCNFGGFVSLGGSETVFAEMRDSVLAGTFSTSAGTSTIDRCKVGFRLPYFDGPTATVTDSIFVPGSGFTSQPADIQGAVTLNRCTFDFTRGNEYSTAWLRTAGLNLNITNSAILNRQNAFYGLVRAALYTDSITLDHCLIQGPTSDYLALNYEGTGAYATYADALAGIPGLAVTNTRFVADAKLDLTTYEPLAGSLAVGQAIPVANAPDYTGTIWANRRTAGALETLSAPTPWSASDIPNLLDIWDALPTGTYQDAAKTIAAGADGNPVGGWVGQFAGAELTQSGAARPTLTTVGGKRALAFNGSASFNTISVPTGGGLTMAFVVNFPILGTIQALYADSNSDHSAIVDSAGRIVVDGGGLYSSRSYAGGKHTVIIRESANRTEIWVDGIRDSSANAASGAPATMSLSLFNINGSFAFQGSLYGLGIIGEWITDDDLAGLNAALAAAT